MARKVLILASGGLDSTVLMALYKNLGYEVHVLYIDYGNINHNIEESKLADSCKQFNILKVNQTHMTITIPWSNSSCIDNGGKDLYVEMRNLIFLANAISLAEAKEIDLVAIGFIKVPVGYSDTSLDFLANINQLSSEAIGVSVVAPLIELDKRGVWNLGNKLGVKLKYTFSCNKSSSETPCGKCPDCLDISELIEKERIAPEDNPFLITN